MGGNQPNGFLKCDGSLYQISNYPDLSDYFYNQFGSKNYFGGNGTTTFGVPNLQGEFLRGAGTNSHANQGDGAAIGTHQDATEHLRWALGSGLNGIYIGSANSPGTRTDTANMDFYAPKSGSVPYRAAMNGTQITTATYNTYYTARPTNTSVLYIIKAKYTI